MRYIKEFKEIDWDDWVEEEIDLNGNIFLTIDEIIKIGYIHVDDRDKLKFARLLDNNDIKWASGKNTIIDNELPLLFDYKNNFIIISKNGKYVLGYYFGVDVKDNFRKR